MGNLLAVGVPPLPMCRTEITFRVATMADLPFLDALQKQHNKALGFFPRAQMEGYVSNQGVLIAEVGGGGSEVGDRDGISRPTTDHPQPTPVGYVISRDRYLKRDELGVIYQLCVVPGDQRKLIGASLIKAVFERSAYGCRLYCCWCAQDLGANHFWESMGFLPIAFRAGSTGKRRVHIFWQRRINADDLSTAYWYPCMTNNGAIREDRLVFPIPPGTHWTEVRAVAVSSGNGEEKGLALAGQRPPREKRARKPIVAAVPQTLITGGGLRFATPQAPPAQPDRVRSEKPKTPRAKIDPRLVSKARELRDRYLEHVNAAALPPPARGKYDLSRQLQAPPAIAQETPFLTAA